MLTRDTGKAYFRNGSQLLKGKTFEDNVWYAK